MPDSDPDVEISKNLENTSPTMTILRSGSPMNSPSPIISSRYNSPQIKKSFKPFKISDMHIEIKATEDSVEK
jgi:hypothetical protein